MEASLQGSGSRPSLCPPSRALSRLCRGPGEESPRQWWPRPGEPRAAWLLEGQAGPGGGVLAPSSWLSSHPWAEPVPGVCVYVCVGWGTGWELGWLGALLLSWGGTPGGGGAATSDRGDFVPKIAPGAVLSPDKEPSVSEDVPERVPSAQ